jgi:hypothetical protein
MKKCISARAADLVADSTGVATTLDNVHATIGAPLNQLDPPQNGGLQPQPMPMPPVRLRNVRATNAGNFTGPFNPVGAPRQAMTPYGCAIGQVM